jgi:hypothetical protein
MPCVSHAQSHRKNSLFVEKKHFAACRVRLQGPPTATRRRIFSFILLNQGQTDRGSNFRNDPTRSDRHAPGWHIAECMLFDLKGNTMAKSN